MKLVIFIGHFKTGSSSIQSFLSSNFLRLLQAGILYPSVESQGTSRNMRSMLSGRDYSSVGESLNIIEPHNALALQLKTEEDRHGVPPYYPNLPSGFQMLELISNQIRELRPQAMVLCSEVFALFGMTEERKSIQRLANRFSGHDVTIYCNLRRPDEYLSSWHRQRLKFGARLERLSGAGLEEYLGSAHVQQARMIEGWTKDHFPNAKLVVRNFDEVKAAGGSIRDFITQSDLPFPSGLSIPKDQNPSVPSAFAEIGRRSIHDLPRDYSSFVIKWLTEARKRVPHPDDRSVEVFGPQNRELLMHTFMPISRNIDAMTGGSLFYKDIGSFGKCNQVSDLDAAREALPKLILDSKKYDFPDEVKDWLKSLYI